MAFQANCAAVTRFFIDILGFCDILLAKGDRSIAKAPKRPALLCDFTLLFFVLDISENLCYTVIKKEFFIGTLWVFTPACKVRRVERSFFFLSLSK